MNKILLVLLSIVLFSCSSTTTEYRTATTALRQEKDVKKAEEFALKAIDLYPEDALPAYFLAMEVYGTKQRQDYAKAYEYFEKALEMDKLDEKEQKLEASKMVPSNDGPPIELKTIKQAIEYYSYNLWVETFNKGIELQTAGQLNEAIEMFHVANKFKPDDLKNYTALAELYFKIQDFSSFNNYADKALEQDNSLSRLWSFKGEIALNNGDYFDAEVNFKKAWDAAISNKEPIANINVYMNLLFSALFNQGKQEAALALNEDLIASDPVNIDLYYNSGVVYQNIFTDNFKKSQINMGNLNSLNAQDKDELIEELESCINFANKSRDMFLMCSGLAENESDMENYDNQAKELKTYIKQIKSQIKMVKASFE